MYKLGDKLADSCGNKAKLLSMLKTRGYNIPLGVVIEFEEFKNIIRTQNISFENIDKIVVPDELIDRIFNVIPQGKTYAIRSSVNIEDIRNLSLAGRYETYLNVAMDKEMFKEKIKSCFLSMYSTDNLQFYRKNKIDINKVEMNIIIQEMIESNASGILFTVNPINGKDTQVVIEFSRGSSQITNYNAQPERLVYDWMSEEYVEEPKINYLGESITRKIIQISLALAQELGLPIDVEFGVYDSKLYIFQVRPISKIENRQVYYRYVNTDSQILSKFTTSMIEKINKSISENILENLDINDIEQVENITMIRFSRIYWNLTSLKNVVENIPGYIERNLDESLNVMIDYLDNGKSNIGNSKRKSKLFSKKNVLEMLKKESINIVQTRLDYEAKINRLKAEKSSIESELELKNGIYEAINYYYGIKTAYVWQRLINLMLKINLNDTLGNLLTRAELNNLFVGVPDEYSNAPLLYMWDVSRKIKKDSRRMEFMEKNLDAEIYYLYRKETQNPYIKDFLTDFIKQYGYHSFNEKDIIYKTYDEEILKVIKMFRDLLEVEDSFDPLQTLREENRLYEKSIEKIMPNLKKSQLKNVLKEIEYIRERIRDVYELKDLSLRIQSILRKYLLELGKLYKSKYILEDEEDIFYLDYKQILNVDEEKVKQNVSKNKIYFNSFRNYKPLQDIYPTDKPQIVVDNSKVYLGIGASFGKVKARATVIKEKADTKKIKNSDIVVLAYVDAEILKNIDFSEISGIVSINGGMLSHIAVIARENGIPAVMDAKEAVENINTGDIVQINGENGQIKM